jgi:ribonuclease BN (tRNA processing enzyme)
MELQFLGIGSAFNPVMENTNAFFRTEKEFYLLDCGETAFGKLWNLEAFTSSSRVTVLITHLHCDHSGSLGSLVSYTHLVLKKEIRVIHPLETVKTLLDLMGIERSAYTWLPSLPQGEAYTFEPVEVDHVDNMRCFAYIISGPEGKIYYSGDAKYIPDNVLASFMEGEIGRIYQDSCLEGGEHGNHGSFACLEKTFPPEKRGRVYCMHLDRDYRRLIAEKGFSVAIKN